MAKISSLLSPSAIDLYGDRPLRVPALIINGDEKLLNPDGVMQAGIDRAVASRKGARRLNSSQRLLRLRFAPLRRVDIDCGLERCQLEEQKWMMK